METKKNLLLIGGTKQNIGKTTFTCDVIKAYSPNNKIIAIKTSCHFHGILDTDIVIANNDKFVIVKETVTNTGKDSARMLGLGANEVYFIQSKDEFIGEAYSFLEKYFDNNSLIICESASLRSYIKSSVFIVLKASEDEKIPDNKTNLHKADIFVIDYLSKVENIDIFVEIRHNCWKLTNKKLSC
ncbi:MAG: hypothetical protein KAH10_04275 [Flavobacteriales bacterium]|nr:hypothetical protein [Flavobacteriales bacterium]